MKKLVLIVAVLAAMFLAAPAMAQTGTDIVIDDVVAGKVEQNTAVANESNVENKTAAKIEAKGGPAPQAKAGGAQAKAAKAQLPATGGGTSLFALGAGALLVAGGLLARRILR